MSLIQGCSLQDVAKPVTDLDFPSVTICSSGLNMEAVRRALYNDFANWKVDNKRVQGLDDQKALSKYMEEKYAMTIGEGNIFDTIKGMNSPPVGETEKGNNAAAVVSSLASCVKKNESRRESEKDESIGTNTRMKRSAVEGKLATRTAHTK